MADDYWSSIVNQAFGYGQPLASSAYTPYSYTPTYSAPQQLIGTAAGSSGTPAMSGGYTPQTLIADPYAAMPGSYSSGGYGASGPPMTNQMSNWNNNGIATSTQNPAASGGSSSGSSSSPYGDLSGVPGFNDYMTGQGYWQDRAGTWYNKNIAAIDVGAALKAFGDLSGSGYPSPSGGAGLDGYTSPAPSGPTPIFAGQDGLLNGGGYTQPTNGVQTSSTSPYGGLVPVTNPSQPASPTGGAQVGGYTAPAPSGPAPIFSQQPGDGYTAPVTSPYGGLTNTAATGGAQVAAPGFDQYMASQGYWQDRAGTWYDKRIAAVTPDQLNGFMARYSDQPAPTPPPRPSSIDTGGAGLQPGPSPIDTQPQNPAQPYGGDTFQQQTNWNADQVAQSGGIDTNLNYYDYPQGPYGSLAGGDETPGNPYDTAVSQQPSNPANPLMLPTSQNSASSSPQVPAQNYFAQNVQPTSQNNYQTAYGNLQYGFDMQGSPYAGMTDKTTDRVPQTGGFVSYGPSYDSWMSNQGYRQANGGWQDSEGRMLDSGQEGMWQDTFNRTFNATQPKSNNIFGNNIFGN